MAELDGAETVLEALPEPGVLVVDQDWTGPHSLCGDHAAARALKVLLLAFEQIAFNQPLVLGVATPSALLSANAERCEELGSRLG